MRRLPYLEPSEPIRSKFQYNNIMFMTAGYLVDSLTGMPWEEAVRKRIFEPLEMTGSNFSVKDSQKTADFAKPYDDRDDQIVEIPFRDITNAGPAGSINSSVTDMARWLIVNSQKGKIGGRQIISRSGAGRHPHAAHDDRHAAGSPRDRSGGLWTGMGRRRLPRSPPGRSRRRNRRILGDDDHLILRTAWGSSCCPT